MVEIINEIVHVHVNGKPKPVGMLKEYVNLDEHETAKLCNYSASS